MHPIVAKYRSLKPDGRFEWLLLGLTVLFWVPTMWMFTVLIWGALMACGWWTNWARRQFLTCLFVASPFFVMPMVSFAEGTVHYVRGEAVWKGSGLMRGDRVASGDEYVAQSLELHSTYRVPPVSSGCMVDGTELFTDAPHNGAVATWTLLFGYQEQPYHGPIPEAEAAYQRLKQSGKTVSGQSLTEKATRRRLGIDRDLAGWLDQRVGSDDVDVDVYYADWTGDTFLISSNGPDFSPLGSIYLVDRDSQRAVAALRVPDDAMLNDSPYKFSAPSDDGE